MLVLKHVARRMLRFIILGVSLRCSLATCIDDTLFDPGKSGAGTGLVERLDVDELDTGTLDNFANQIVGQSKQFVQSHFDVSLARSFEKQSVTLAAIFGNDSFVEIVVTTLEVVGFSDLDGGDDDHVG